MTIELHIDGKLNKKWIRDDIREDYSEEGTRKWKGRIDKIINGIKENMYEQLQIHEYQFYVVYESSINSLHFTDADLALFNKEVTFRMVDRIALKYKSQKAS